MTPNAISRRSLFAGLTAAAGLLATPRVFIFGELLDEPFPIIDSHVHVWDLKQFHLPWLDHNTAPLNRDYSVADYRDATKALNIGVAVYVEVNVATGQEELEARYVTKLCEDRETLFAAGVIAGDPRDPGFHDYIDRSKESRAIKGVRFHYPLNGSDDPAFLRGLRELGKRGLSFDLQVGPTTLADAAIAVKSCPDTQFILNHCGGGDPHLFRPAMENELQARHAREDWRRGIGAVAKQPNAVCKISGVADSALPGEATAEDVAPIVNFCLDEFGPDRVLFGGNWPVCLRGTTLEHWVQTLGKIISARSDEDRRKLLRSNARRVYRLGEPRPALHRD